MLLVTLLAVVSSATAFRPQCFCVHPFAEVGGNHFNVDHELSPEYRVVPVFAAKKDLKGSDYNDDDNDHTMNVEEITSQDKITVSKCPILNGSGNNDFEQFDGLWFRIQEEPDNEPTKCSLNVYHLIGNKTHDLILRVPPANQSSQQNNDSFVRVGKTQKVDNSSWIEVVKVGNAYNMRLVTVLTSDYHRGEALIHLCDLHDAEVQGVQMLSRKRKLDKRTVRRYRQLLVESGLGRLERNTHRVEQEDCDGNDEKLY